MHTEAVTGVVGRAELISSIFFIMAIVSYRKERSNTKRVNYLDFDKIPQKTSQNYNLLLQSEAATCSEGLEKDFLRVPQAVRQYYSCCAAKVSKGNFHEIIQQNIWNKLPPQPVILITKSDLNHLMEKVLSIILVLGRFKLCVSSPGPLLRLLCVGGVQQGARHHGHRGVCSLRGSRRARRQRRHSPHPLIF